jgi:hypothetical protein
MRSKWVQALQFAHYKKIVAGRLSDFMDENGGIAGCAAELATLPLAEKNKARTIPLKKKTKGSPVPAGKGKLAPRPKPHFSWLQAAAR